MPEDLRRFNNTPEDKAKIEKLNVWKPTEDEVNFIKYVIMLQYFEIAKRAANLIWRNFHEIKNHKFDKLLGTQNKNKLISTLSYFESIDGQKTYDQPREIYKVVVFSKFEDNMYKLTLWHGDSSEVRTDPNIAGYGKILSRPIIIECVDTDEKFELDFDSPSNFESKEKFNEKIEDLNILLRKLGFGELLNIEKHGRTQNYISKIP